jgi:hypothetical protein
MFFCGWRHRPIGYKKIWVVRLFFPPDNGLFHISFATVEKIIKQLRLSSEVVFLHLNFLAISSSLHRVILNLFSSVSYASDMTIVDVLQTSLPSYLPYKGKWNVWKVAIRLLPMIVNFCKNSLFAFLNHVSFLTMQIF